MESWQERINKHIKMYLINEHVINLLCNLFRFSLITLWKNHKHYGQNFKIDDKHAGKSLNMVEQHQNLINEHDCLLDTWE